MSHRHSRVVTQLRVVHHQFDRVRKVLYRKGRRETPTGCTRRKKLPLPLFTSLILSSGLRKPYLGESDRENSEEPGEVRSESEAEARIAAVPKHIRT